jgi:hypothetical protein
MRDFLELIIVAPFAIIGCVVVLLALPFIGAVIFVWLFVRYMREEW